MGSINYATLVSSRVTTTHYCFTSYGYMGESNNFHIIIIIIIIELIVCILQTSCVIMSVPVGET